MHRMKFVRPLFVAAIVAACTPYYYTSQTGTQVSATQAPNSNFGFGGYSGGSGSGSGITFGAPSTPQPTPYPTYYVPQPIPTYYIPPTPYPTYYVPQPVPTYYIPPTPYPTYYYPQPSPTPGQLAPYAEIHNIGDTITATYENIPPYWPPRGHEADGTGLKDYDTTFQPYLNIWSDQIPGWDLLSPLVKINRVSGKWESVSGGAKLRATFTGVSFIQVSWPGNLTFERNNQQLQKYEKRFMDIDNYPGTTSPKVRPNFPTGFGPDGKDQQKRVIVFKII